ncbi:MSCRAMM family protein [Pseudopontixanthobacter vadosimaris]|uniref:MSCRAMM family protein n=1 Tax=Pseudopontixanthobacter vadosimaris TaxID=2726450 RepID=UPI0014748194|nr:carboxypeptidase regulatory-like domain-containing protein [Pseudopontixanthobacter vadosimaris]
MALGACGTAVAQSPDWQANDDDFLLLQITVGQYRLTDDVRGYQMPAGICLDLADVVRALDMPLRIDRKSRRATGWLFSEDQTFTLDRDSGRVVTGNNRVPIDGAIVDTPEGWCVRVASLSSWFGLELEPDLFNSAIRMTSAEPLPFIEAINRKNRAARLPARRKDFDLGRFPRADTEYRIWRTPSVNVVLSAGVNGGAGRKFSSNRRAEAYLAGEIAAASVTARISTDQDFVPQTLRVRAFRNAPDGGLLGPLDATQIAAGDVETLSGQLTGQTSVGRGAFISNRPLGSSARFAATTLRGTLPTGWDAELYRNGQLIAFQGDTEDGRYEFLDVDLFYGGNDLEVVLYGPQGQVRRESVNLPVGFNQIEPGQTYYWAGIVEKDRDLVTFGRSGDVANALQPGGWRWGAGVEHGIDKRTSVSLGAHSLLLANRRRHYVESTVWRTFGAMQAELVAAHEVGEGAVFQGNALGRIGSVNLGASAVWKTGDYLSDFVSEDLDYRFGVQADMSLQLGGFSLPFQFGAGQAVERGGERITEWQIATALRAGRINLGAELERETRDDPARSIPDTGTRLQLLANTVIRKFRLRGNAGFDLSEGTGRFDFAQLSLQRDLTEDSELRAQVEYLGPSDLARLSLGYTHRFSKFALRADATYASDGGIGANLSLAFSLGPDPIGGGFRVSESKFARNGQVQVTVFRDENGDGVHSQGEDLLPGIGVEAGFRLTGAVTDENGRALVDGLRPHAPVLVGIDEASLGDPYLIPQTEGVVLIPRPGVMASLMLPVSPSGEVEGVIRSPGGVDLGGVMLELLDLRGNPVASTISEYDGFFLFDRVPYGTYRLQVVEDSASKLQVRRALAAGIVIARGDDVARLGIVSLQSAVFRPLTMAGAAGPDLRIEPN